MLIQNVVLLNILKNIFDDITIVFVTILLYKDMFEFILMHLKIFYITTHKCIQKNILLSILIPITNNKNRIKT